MESSFVYRQIKDFFARELLEGEDMDLDLHTPLLDVGLINSMSIAMLSDFLRSEFSIDIPPHELRPENLKTLGAITDTVLRLANAGPDA